MRLQFHVVTDGHDQMEAPLQAFVDTLNALNQPQPELVCTDNVPGDKEFFLRTLPSLRARQAELEGANPPPVAAPIGSLPLASATREQIGRVIKGAVNINSAVSALRDQLDALPKPQQVVSLDAEWDVTLTAHGMQASSGKVALVQLGYDLQDGKGKKAMLLHVSGLTKLPDRLHSFIADTAATSLLAVPSRTTSNASRKTTPHRRWCSMPRRSTSASLRGSEMWSRMAQRAWKSSWS